MPRKPTGRPPGRPKKPRIGRPPKAPRERYLPIQIRLAPADLAAVDATRAPGESRPVALRRAARRGLGLE